VDVFWAVPDSPLFGFESASVLFDAPSDESLDVEVELDFEREPLELERSFFAQPEPLNTTAGAANALRSVPSAPQTGQNRGAGTSMPWMTSVVCPQFEHR